MSEIVDCRVRSIYYSFHIAVTTKDLKGLFSQVVRHYHIPSSTVTAAIVTIDLLDQLIQGFRSDYFAIQYFLPLLYFVCLVNWNNFIVFIGHNGKTNWTLTNTTMEKNMFISPVNVLQKLLYFPRSLISKFNPFSHIVCCNFLLTSLENKFNHNLCLVIFCIFFVNKFDLSSLVVIRFLNSPHVLNHIFIIFHKDVNIFP